MEKTVRREEIYNGKVIHVVKDDVVLDDGSKAKREIVLHNGGVCIALKDKSDNKYFMVKQYRIAQGKDMIEFCAGKIEKGEEVDSAIYREAIEETGYEATNVVKFGYIAPTCGYSSEKIYLYYGEVGNKLGQHLDVDERIDTLKYSFKEIKEMIKNGTIDDAKTIALILHIEMAGIDE